MVGAGNPTEGRRRGKFLTRRNFLYGLGGLGVLASDAGAFLLARYTAPSEPGSALAPSSSGSPASTAGMLRFGKYWVDGIDIDGGADPVTGAPRTTFVLLKMRPYDSADPDGRSGTEYDGVIRAKDMAEAQLLDANLRDKKIEIHSLPPNSAHEKIGGGFVYELEARDFEIDNMVPGGYRRTLAPSVSRIPGSV